MPLKINVSNLSYEPKAYEYKGSHVMIRPWPASRNEFIYNGKALVMTGEKQLERFTYCLAGWDFLDGEGKALPCNPDTKRLIFDHNLEPELVTMVMEVSTSFHEEKETQEKNSTSGPDTNSGE